MSCFCCQYHLTCIWLCQLEAIPNLKHLPKLEALYLNNNNISGSLQPLACLSKRLLILDVRGNQFGGDSWDYDLELSVLRDMVVLADLSVADNPFAANKLFMDKIVDACTKLDVSLVLRDCCVISFTTSVMLLVADTRWRKS